MSNSNGVLRAVAFQATPFEIDAGRRSHSGRRINSEEAREEAERILAKARLEADQLRRAAAGEAAAQKAELQKIIQEAAEKGYEEGFSEGREEALAGTKAEIGGLVDQAAGWVEALREERVRNLRGQEPQIIDLAIAIAEQIVRAQTALDPEMVARIATAAVERSTEREEVTVLVHPNDLTAMEMHIPHLKERFKALRNVYIREDARISPGGCMLETANGYVDGTLERQLSEMRRELGLED